jgi:hypothetical protein
MLERLFRWFRWAFGLLDIFPTTGGWRGGHSGGLEVFVGEEHVFSAC